MFLPTQMPQWHVDSGYPEDVLPVAGAAPASARDSSGRAT